MCLCEQSLTGCGVALLEDQLWTLNDKATRIGSVQGRHDRHGLVSGCQLGGFGDSADCINGDDDNNGLWTSLVVAAEVFHYVATKDPAAADLAWHYYDGMRLLNRITGIRVRHGAVSEPMIVLYDVCVLSVRFVGLRFVIWTGRSCFVVWCGALYGVMCDVRCWVFACDGRWLRAGPDCSIGYRAERDTQRWWEVDSEQRVRVRWLDVEGRCLQR